MFYLHKRVRVVQDLREGFDSATIVASKVICSQVIIPLKKKKKKKLDNADLTTDVRFSKDVTIPFRLTRYYGKGEMAERVETHLKVYQMLYNNNTMH